jgi:hypothetical protein
MEELENIILSEVSQLQKKTDGVYSLISGWILAQKLRIPKIQFAKHIKIKKKEDQSVSRMGNKIPMEEVTETTFGAEPQGTTIQRLPHLRIHSINNHQTQTLG